MTSKNDKMLHENQVYALFILAHLKHNIMPWQRASNDGLKINWKLKLLSFEMAYALQVIFPYFISLPHI
jgi:hypothetical protein